ncbi:MAG: hypothetical protein II781_03580 [Clostridia bacterium]|nr:hypothetical protein [Clostridia bacterium]
MQKRITALLLIAVLLILPLTGCGSKSGGKGSAPAGDASVLLEENGLKVVYRGFVDEPGEEPYLDLEIANSGERDLRLSILQLIVNGYMLENPYFQYTVDGSPNTGMDLDIAAGKTGMYSLRITRYEMNLIGIKAVGTVEGKFDVSDAREGDALFVTKMFRVETGTAEEIAESGTPVYDGEGIRIYVRGTMNDGFSENAVISVVNDTDKEILVTCRECLVNGEAREGFYSSVVAPGKRSVTFLGFGMDFQGTVEELAVSFMIYENPEDWDMDSHLIAETELVKVRDLPRIIPES